MNKFSVTCRVLSFCLPLFSTPLAYGMQGSPLEEFINSIKGQEISRNQVISLLESKPEHEHASICQEVKNQGGSFLVFAKKMELPTLKTMALSSHCLSYTPPKQASFIPGQLESDRYPKPVKEYNKQAVIPSQLESNRYPKPVKEEERQEKEVGKLSLPSIGTPSEPTVSQRPVGKIVIPKFLRSEKGDTKDALENAKQTILNIQSQMESQGEEFDKEEKERVKQQLGAAEEELKKATDNYGNMEVLVAILREEVSGLYNRSGQQFFKNFNPPSHENDSHEEYLTSILKQQEDIEQAKRQPQNEAAIDQLGGAKKMLDDCKKELEEARQSLETIGQ